MGCTQCLHQLQRSKTARHIQSKQAYSLKFKFTKRFSKKKSKHQKNIKKHHQTFKLISTMICLVVSSLFEQKRTNCYKRKRFISLLIIRYYIEQGFQKPKA